MRAYIGLIIKEFRQVFRDRNMLRIIFVLPIIQLLVLGYAVDLDVKYVATDVYDFDRTKQSRDLIAALEAGDYFITNDVISTEPPHPVSGIRARFQSGDSEMALIIPADFSENIRKGRPAALALTADGSNASQASTAMAYASQIIAEYSAGEAGAKPLVEIRPRVLYNPEQNSVNFMVPGIVATLLTMITVMLTSMAIVREKEVGTLEQIMVTPISRTAFLAGKLTAFAILGFFEISFALAVGILWFGIPFAGSPLLLFGLAAVYLISTLGVGLFFSTITGTQQQAMFFAWFFSVFVILTSGFMTPISNMPRAIQYITYLNPMRYFLAITRGIMMRGAGARELATEIYSMLIYGATIFIIAALRFKKRAG
ncbi:MAG TPA: ABC transporter permease [Candidatus Krumholzibacterium sp.]|nr:ABC transporter permease [Candidatus Krumholzibacterium sp.]